jgi:phage terminase large subunit-like protein
MVDSPSHLYLAGPTMIPTHNSTFGSIIAEDALIKSELVGYFAPDYKRLTEIINEISEVIEPVRKYPSGGRDIIRTITGGRLDFWTLEDLTAGRSRKYHKVIIDEAAFTKPNMMEIWNKSIKPTLLDYRGSALILSNTNGADPDQFFWKICNEPQHGFKEYHAPSQQNPLLPREDLADWAKTMHPLVYAQEILADFVDWSGVAFFAKDKMLDNGLPIPFPKKCDSVFAVIDTAVKTGKDNDGTAVSFYARSKFGRAAPLIVLDWDIVQIEGALLETWLPQVFRRLEELAKQCGAVMGSVGCWIEDKSSGSILLQQAKRRDWNARPIESTLTALGKDERAINASGYYHQGLVKISQEAYDKTTTFKEATRNHFISQICGFRIGDKTSNRQDDLLDTFCYAIALALGNTDGY